MFRVILRQNIKYVRYKHKDNHWSVQKKKKFATDKALEHFDDFYQQVFMGSWPKIREGLLAKKKYIAVLNNYSDLDEAKTKLELTGALNVRQLFELQQQYMIENRKKFERKAQLETIWKLDKAMTEKEQTETEVKIDVDVAKDHVMSLESKLKEADLDSTRIVDSKQFDAGAILQEFIPASRIKGRDDFIPESSHYKYYENTTEFPIKIEKEVELHFPKHLEVYCYEKDNFNSFPPPKRGSTEVLDYYLLDGSSLLPLLALDLKPGSKVLDLCASPGGKSLLAIQTLYPKLVVANDVTMSRTNRIYKVFKEYLYDLNEKWIKADQLRITTQDGRFMVEDNFDRILVDVPCTTDRHSVIEDENNIFRPDRIKERLQLPELQSDLLVNALKLVRVGGIVVYSTCSLSPIQNDGVVHMALKKIWEETRVEIVIKDLNGVLRQTKSVFKLAGPKVCKYGNLVLPNVSQNYGPMYFCKLQRIK